MKQTPQKLIKDIANEIGEGADLLSILEVLEDGEALASLGFTDENQCDVEKAYAVVRRWMQCGLEYFDEVAA